MTPELSHKFQSSELLAASTLTPLLLRGFSEQAVGQAWVTPRCYCQIKPHSGGKTTLASSIFLSQLFTQLGLRVPCERVTISVADKLMYQGPTFAELDSEGRLGTELEVTKNIMEESSPSSLLIMGEFAGGTSSKERFYH